MSTNIVYNKEKVIAGKCCKCKVGTIYNYIYRKYSTIDAVYHECDTCDYKS